MRLIRQGGGAGTKLLRLEQDSTGLGEHEKVGSEGGPDTDQRGVQREGQLGQQKESSAAIRQQQSRGACEAGGREGAAAMMRMTTDRLQAPKQTHLPAVPKAAQDAGELRLQPPSPHTQALVG
ncbi:MAG: hypothetical protein FRX49_02635 [Trebouxia sp. A1-2]|nr:MAG: hypothetical protein FRX49_02635 [Trebouxia sp. A1-2]